MNLSYSFNGFLTSCKNQKYLMDISMAKLRQVDKHPAYMILYPTKSGENNKHHQMDPVFGISWGYERYTADIY